MNDAVDYERLLAELGVFDAGCVTAVADAGMDAVIRCFGGDPGRVLSCGSLASAEAEFGIPGDERYLIGVAEAGPAVTVVEIGGFQGSRAAVLCPLSRFGRAASAYWGIDADSALTLAEDGQVLSTFEMLLPDDRQGARPEAWAPFLDGLTFGPDAGELGTLGVRAIARATGARLDDVWAGGLFRIVWIEPVPEPDLPLGLEESPLRYEQPYASYIADLGPHRHRQMRRHAFDLALHHTGLSEDPLATAAIAEIEQPSAEEAIRTRTWAEVTAAKTTALAEAESERSDLAVRRAELWSLLEMQLAEPAFVHGAVFMLQRVMTGQGDLVDRYWFLDALYEAAERRAQC